MCTRPSAGSWTSCATWNPKKKSSSPMEAARVSSLRRVIKADQVRLTSAGQLVASRPPLARTATEQRFGPDPAVAAIEAQQILQVAQDRAAEIQRAAQEQAAETARQARAEGLRAAEAEIAQLLLS